MFSDIYNVLVSRSLPSENDIIGAQEAILRLQSTFSLTPRQIAEGILPNVPSYTKLGMLHCLHQGVYILSFLVGGVGELNFNYTLSQQMF